MPGFRSGQRVRVGQWHALQPSRGRLGPVRALRPERLESRRLLALGGFIGPIFTSQPLGFEALPANIDSHLTQLVQDFTQPSLETWISRIEHSVDPTQPIKLPNSLVQLDSTGSPLVSIWTRVNPAEVLGELATLGATIVSTNDTYHLIEAVVELSDLAVLAASPRVLSVTPVYRPISHAGSVQTQGDAVLNADDVRALGVDGTSVLVGVMSDSAYRIATSQATGDLPAVVDRYLEFPATDEGRAMLEIVSDIAPGASLAHHSAILSEVSFADGIRKLAAAGSRVIVDDIRYYSEPFFQDGIIARAVNEVTASGVLYISAAGNDASRSYEATFSDADPGTAADFHDFDPSPSVDTRQQVTVPSGYGVTLILQWDDPFYTTSGVTHDFDVKVYDSIGAVVKSGVTTNLSTQQPLEVVQWIGQGNGTYFIEIERKAGGGVSQLKYELSTNSNVGTIDEYATNSGTVLGHAAAVGAIAVGAVPYYSPDTIEPFSSQGNATIYFDSAGVRLTIPEVRQKPDVVAPDNANTTFFGSDIPQDTDSLPNFAGTSAAAPHVAGVAAILLDANPHLTRDDLYSVITTTAVDLGPAGRDRTYGFGRVDAAAAHLAALAVSDVTSPKAQLRSPIATHGWDVDKLVLALSEPLSSATAASTANYSLVGAGIDGMFATVDDVTYPLIVDYNYDSRSVTLTKASLSSLADGQYRLTLDATGGLTDEAGNALNGGTDQVINFTVGDKSAVLTFPSYEAYSAYESGLRVELRPDGTAVMVYPNNPVLGRYKWPQVMVKSLPSGESAGRPFHTIPTDIEDSFRVQNPDVAVNATSGVIVYSDYDEIVYGEPDSYSITYQLIDADGRAVGGRQLAASIDGGTNPEVAMNSSGAFAIVFMDQDYDSTIDRYPAWIKGRLFDSAGQPTTSVFNVSQQSDVRDAPVVAIRSDGGAIFVWDMSGQIYARRFSSTGASLGNEFRVSDVGTVGRDPQISMAADGSFVVVWTEGTTVRWQRFDASGNAQGQSVRAFPRGDMPQVAMAADGRFVVAWRGEDGGNNGVFAQRFNADGSFAGGRLWANGAGAGDQGNPQVAILADGRFILTWQESNGAPAARWYSWDAPDDQFPFGPWIHTITPSQPVTSAISNVTVSFDRAIDPSTFTAPDITLIDPAGRNISAAGVSTTDNRTFTISFASQQLAGRYRLQIGPNIADVAGNLMNQNGNAVNAETTDGFSGFFWRTSLTKSTISTSETFDVASVDALAGSWSFASDSGMIQVTGANGPHSGIGHLEMNGTAVNSSSSREAVLLLDLAAQSTSTNLSLDFWLKRLGVSRSSSNYAYLYVSGDGRNWSQVGSDLNPSTNGQYAHFVFDLDKILIDAGVALDGDVYLKFAHYSYYSGSIMTFDDIQVSNLDVFGPKIVAQSPAGLVSPPLSSFTVTFNEEIDASTFTASDVLITDPLGSPIALSGSPVDFGDHLNFRIDFASTQSFNGTYRIAIGPDVRDLAGVPMNQDGDAIVGSTSDLYNGVIQAGGIVGAVIPYVQGFEDGSLGPLTSNWSFAAGSGTIDVTSADNPHSGSYHLRMTHSGSGTTDRVAVLKLDLSAQVAATDLSLDFYVNRVRFSRSFSNYAYLDVSNDGVAWTLVGELDSVTYGRFSYDLDQLLNAKGIVRDTDVFLRFRHTASAAGSVMAFDDIRVSNLDVIGPRVVSQSISGLLAGPVDTFTVTFDEAIDATTFTADDVQLIAPSGVFISLAADPADTGDQRTFQLSLAAAQSLTGAYTLRIGPQVRDLGGNLMNQDLDPTEGEASADMYVGAFQIGPAVAQAFPYTQSFENSILESLSGWSFDTTGGTIEVAKSDAPHGGLSHLKMKQTASHSTTDRTAYLNLDLSSQASVNDLFLSFWAKKFGNFTSGLQVLASGTGASNSYVTIGSFGSNSNIYGEYQHVVIDLDQALQSQGIARDTDVYLAFRHSGYYTIDALTIDDIEIGNGDVFGPRITAHSPLQIAAGAGPLSSITLTFNDAIDAASFTDLDVTLKNPAGFAIPVTVSEVPGSGHTQFNLTFANQGMRGDYRLQVGPAITDLLGNTMNQDGDEIIGEAIDAYSATIPYAGVTLTPAVSSVLYAESFESWPASIPNYWSFYSANTGTISAATVNAPFTGQSHLWFDHNGPDGANPTMMATLAIDLSAQASRTDLVLDFWAKWATAGGSLAADLSTDGNNYRTIWSSSLSSSYTHYAFDLDAFAQSNSIPLDADVYLRFRSFAGSYSSTREDFVDDLRIRTGSLNNAPTLSSINALTGATEDLDYTITYDSLLAAANEADINGDTLSFRVETITGGVLTKAGLAVTPGVTLLGPGESLTWRPPADANGTLNAFTVQAWDGDLISGIPIQVRVTVAPANDAPVLDNSGSPTLLASTEDASSPSVSTVTSFIGSSITDIDAGAFKGIAIVGSTGAADGAWQYSTNGGGTWLALGAVSEGAARLLRDTDRLRFAGNANFNGTVTITYRAWDQVTGTFGSTVDLTVPGATGGTTSYSTAVETASLTINAVNDAPVLDNAGNMTLIPINEDDTTNSGMLVSAVISSAGGDRITDVDIGAPEGIAVTGVVNTSGVWQYSIDGGGNWTPFGSPSASAAVLLAADANTRVRLVPNTDFNGTVSSGLTFRAWDQSSGSNGATVSTSPNGGLTPFSTATEIASITVNPVNDAPSFTLAGGPAAVNEDAGAQSVAAFAANIRSGPASASDETGQTMNFNVAVTGTTGNLVFTTAPAINSATGMLTYTPAADTNGTATITVTLVDSGSNVSPNVNTSSAQTFTITVNAVNDAPSFTVVGNPATVNEDAGAQTVPAFASNIRKGPAIATDEVGQTLNFNVAVTGTTGNLVFSTAPAIDPATGALSYTPAAHTNGTAMVSVTLVDGGSGVSPNVNTSSTQTFTITVNAVNDAPSFSLAGNPAAVNEDAGAQSVAAFASNIRTGPASAVDEVGQSLNFNVAVTGTTGNLVFSTAPAISPTTGALTFTPAANTNGTATISVTLVDGGSGVAPNVNTSLAQTFTITVNAVNDTPSFTLSGNPAAINEDAGAQSVAAFASNIQPGPVAATDEVSQTLNFNVAVTGTTGNLVFSTAPAINPATGALTYTPAADTNGTATISVTLVDGGSGLAPNVNTSAAQIFTITVNAINDAPSFALSGNPAAINEDAGAQSVAAFASNIRSGSAAASDESSQTLNFNVAVTGTTGNLLFSTAPAINPTTGALIYTPAADTNGTATISVTLVDGGSGLAPNVNTSTAHTFTITVNAINDAPSFFIPSSLPAINEDAPPQSMGAFATSIRPGPIAASDESSQTLAFNVAVTGTTGNLTFASPPAIDATNGRLTYSLAPNTNGTATVSVTLTDSGNGTLPHVNTSNARTFTITVNAVNDPPSFSLAGDPPPINNNATAQSVSAFATNMTPGPATAIDETGQTLTFSLSVVSTTGDLAFTAGPAIDPATGTLTYTPAATTSGTATVSVVLRDSGSNALPHANVSPAQTFTIAVSPQWQAIPNPLDVDGDGAVSGIDLVYIVEALNTPSNPYLPARVPPPLRNVDPNGDNYVSGFDLVLLVDALNSSVSLRTLGHNSPNDSVIELDVTPANETSTSMEYLLAPSNSTVDELIVELSADSISRNASLAPDRGLTRAFDGHAVESREIHYRRSVYDSVVRHRAVDAVLSRKETNFLDILGEP